MIKLMNCSKTEFLKWGENKEVYCFGAGKQFEDFLEENPYFCIKGIIDNYKSGKYVSEINAIEYDIFSVDDFSKECSQNTILLITCVEFESVVKQLDSVQKLDGMECYIYLFLKAYTETSIIPKIDYTKKKIIPKKIHYCWFGKNELSDDIQKNIDSWRKFCPDYQIIKWDETNYDVDKNLYMKQAYEKKKWAFVSDYARLDILYREGGIYLDTDVEVVRTFDDLLIWNMFCGHEDNEYVNCGLGVGAVKGHIIIKKILEVYESIPFIYENGRLNTTPCPHYQTKVMREYGFKVNGNFEEKEGIALYPKDFFSPYNYLDVGFGNLTANTYSIHWYDASWIKQNGIDYRKIRMESAMRIKKRMINKINSEG